MKSAPYAAAILLVAVVSLVAPTATRAEMVEEIIAWVNGDIITLSEYEEERQGRIADLYRRLSGEELDREVEQARARLLLSMIDRKILVHHARALGYDIDKMGEAFLDQFMRQQKIDNRQDLERLAEQDGMNLDQIKKRLVESYAPDEVIHVEVSNRISVSDREIEAFYEEAPERFFVEGEVTLREIVLLADTAERKAERRAEAQEVWQAASSGESFGALARQVSEAGTRSSGGLLGPLKRSDLAEALVTTAFSIPVGSVSELMETPYGFHVVRVESRIEDHTRSLDEVRDQVRALLHERKLLTELDAFLEKARAESEWCVKPKHHDLLSIPAPPPCERL